MLLKCPLVRDIRENFSVLDYSTLESLVRSDNMGDIARYIFTVMKKMDEINVIVRKRAPN